MVDNRPGYPFQNFVAALERSISQREGATIESPKRLRDKDTNRLRDHDIVITWQVAHHRIVTSIECKDTGRKVGVPEIESFAKKCERAGVNHPVMVSASGFTKTGSVKADALGVSCMELKEAERFDWMGIDFFVGYERNFAPVIANVFFDGDKPELPISVFDANGKEVLPGDLNAIVHRALPRSQDEDADVGVNHPVLVTARPTGWIAKDASGKVFSISHVELETSFTTQRSESPVALHSYTGQGSTYGVASTDVNLGALKGKLLFIQDDDGVRVVWQSLGVAITEADQ